MKGVVKAPDKSGRIRLAWAKRKGKVFKGGGREILLRHEGLGNDTRTRANGQLRRHPMASCEAESGAKVKKARGVGVTP